MLNFRLLQIILVEDWRIFFHVTFFYQLCCTPLSFMWDFMFSSCQQTLIRWRRDLELHVTWFLNYTSIETHQFQKDNPLLWSKSLELHREGPNSVGLNRVALNRVWLNRVEVNRVALNLVGLNRVGLNLVKLNRERLNLVGLNRVWLNDIGRSQRCPTWKFILSAWHYTL